MFIFFQKAMLIAGISDDRDILCGIRKYSLKLCHKEYSDIKVLYSEHCLWFLFNFF